MAGEGDERGVGVGLIGLGTIGTGVVKVLARNRDVIEKRLGFPLRLVRIADLDTETDRGVDLAGIRFDADAAALIAAPDVEIVIELIGGLIPVIGPLLRVLIPPAALILWIILMVKAYQGERWQLPVIGEIAEERSAIPRDR